MPGVRDDVDAVLKAELFDLLAGERGDRDADVLQRLFALLRGDGDFLHQRFGRRTFGAIAAITSATAPQLRHLPLILNSPC